MYGVHALRIFIMFRIYLHKWRDKKLNAASNKFNFQIKIYDKNIYDSDIWIIYESDV